MNTDSPRSNPYAAPGSFGFQVDYKLASNEFEPPIVVEGRVGATDVVVPPKPFIPRQWRENAASVAYFVVIFSATTWAAITLPHLRFLMLPLLAIFCLIALRSVVGFYRRQMTTAQEPPPIFDDRWFRITFVRAACEIRRASSLCIFGWNSLYVSFLEDGMSIYERREGRTFLLQFIPKRCFCEGDWERVNALVARIYSGS